MLAYANTAIDGIQDAKISFLDKHVTDTSFKEPMVDFVEAQREFTKQVAKTTYQVVDTFVDTFMNTLTRGKK
jgi:hypothetical protein